MRTRLYPLLSWLAGAALLGLTVLAYLPGLHGGFQFDDYANLPAIGATGPITHWATFWRYITSGHADPLGRPITLLSFLLDARDWPAAPGPFLHTNLILHLLNGTLLMLLLRALGRSLASGTVDAQSDMQLRVDLAAMLGAGLWLLHPLLVSTTLYIVQREAMLPATFELLGLLAWLHGRRLAREGYTGRGVAWIIGGLGIGTLLAALSKADGALLPLFALVIEHVLLRPVESARSNSLALQSKRGYRFAMVLVAVLPTMALFAYMAWSAGPALVTGQPVGRPWTVGQRLITEPRVLLDYLRLLWAPRAFTSGLFNDQFTASTSLWTPWTTVPAILAVLGLIVGGWLLRRRLPAVALAIVFYFAGQVLESGIIPLELYFEHRNYVPAMLMFWPLSLWLCGMPQRLGPGSTATAEKPGFRTHPIRVILALAFIAGLAGLTHARASLWGNVNEQAQVWAEINPGSPRAQANAAAQEVRHGQYRKAIVRLRPALARQPDQVQLAINLLGAECLAGHIDTKTLKAAHRAMRHTRDPGTLLVHWFERSIAETSHPPCPRMTLDMLDALVNAALQNHALMKEPGRRQDVWYIKGRIALAGKHPDDALADFDHALSQQVRYAAALKQAALLGEAGYPGLGLEHLDYFHELARHASPKPFGMTRLHAWILKRQDYWPHELAHLHATLVHDVQQKNHTYDATSQTPH